ncbi:hypothetical protein BJY04DRAFT_214507 [Aspergillus karnatakaensis]|uniref:uncharacterized protein n=1 Tax=Aspergillus karnatakaensis TaxID=1810916 RepID=UPI003CCD84B6
MDCPQILALVPNFELAITDTDMIRVLLGNHFPNVVACVEWQKEWTSIYRTDYRMVDRNLKTHVFKLAYTKERTLLDGALTTSKKYPAKGAVWLFRTNRRNSTEQQAASNDQAYSIPPVLALQQPSIVTARQSHVSSYSHTDSSRCITSASCDSDNEIMDVDIDEDTVNMGVLWVLASTLVQCTTNGG